MAGRRCAIHASKWIIMYAMTSIDLLTSAQDLDVKNKIVLPNYTYSSSTANSNLRAHLENYHEEEYVRVCEENGWVMQLPKRKRRVELAKALMQTSLDGIAIPGKEVDTLYLGET